ncbi:MAG: ATP-binding protein [Chloroflexi bacterium]|nr:ATP-binding protein [Chloroflexota bacterium]
MPSHNGRFASEVTQTTAPASALQEGLARLDARIQQAVQQVEQRLGPQADPYRGLVIRHEDVLSLAAHPLSLVWDADEDDDPASVYTHSLSHWLARSFHLARFDLDVLFLALAPETDLRYERLFAYLQDDVTRRRPSIDLALNLFCAGEDSRLAYLAHFAPDAPLVRGGLIELVAPADQPDAPFRKHFLRADRQVYQLLTGQLALTGDLHPSARLIVPERALDDLYLDADLVSTLRTVIESPQRPLQIYLKGPRGTDREWVAEACALASDRLLLRVDLSRLPESLPAYQRLLDTVFRAAWFRGALLFFENVDAVRADRDDPRYENLLYKLAHDEGITLLAGHGEWLASSHHTTHVIPLALETPAFAVRRACWQAHLAALGMSCEDAVLDTVAAQFRLLPAQIAQAAVDGYHRARLRAAGQPQRTPTVADLAAAAQAQSTHELDDLAERLTPAHQWDDLVLPDDALSQLQEIVQRVRLRHRVMDDWQYRRKDARGHGVTVLFAGPSGTGKTMAGEIIARELGLALYRIDLSGVVSKYIGETEKNLSRIFDAANRSHAILFFDEADALFGKRSEVRDAHDRYANIEISYLLQRMETYDGVAILASNLRDNIDDAFLRRLTFLVEFPFPDADSRHRIWQRIWTPETPLGHDVELWAMAEQFRLSGGNIKNIALAAAFLAAAEDQPVSQAHLLHATRREFQKLGRRMPDLAVPE